MATDFHSRTKATAFSTASIHDATHTGGANQRASASSTWIVLVWSDSSDA